MMKLITTIKTTLAKRRAYHHAIIEIGMMAERELADMNIDRDTLIANAHRRVYGIAR